MIALGDRIEAYRGAHILCACSGGADSVALLLLLAEARDAGIVALSAAHLEHGIRGEASKEDARFVRALCARLGVGLTVASRDVPSIARQKKVGLEQAARDERYAFLESVKAEIKADYIALAHHAEDQFETILMHLCRGSGLTGVCGMRPLHGDRVRPLLDFHKEELIEYVRARGEDFREDATNARPDTPRNALRLGAIPAMRAAYPGCVDAAGRFARIARAEDDFMKGAADEWLRGRVKKMPFGFLIAFAECDLPHAAILRRALGALLPDCALDAIDRAAALVNRADGAIELPGGHRFERGAKGLYYIRSDYQRNETILPLADGAALGGVGGVKVTRARPAPVKDDLYRQIVNAAALTGACVRTRRPGDFIRPFGMRGKKPLSDFLIDKKIDRPLRDALLLIAKGDEVLWIAGVALSEALRIREGEAAVEILFTGDKLLP